MTLALAVAASAPSPKNRPTQIELIDPLSDCRMFDAKVGSANRMSVRVIGPDVRSRAPARQQGADAQARHPCRQAQQQGRVRKDRYRRWF